MKKILVSIIAGILFLASCNKVSVTDSVNNEEELTGAPHSAGVLLQKYCRNN